LVDITAVNFGTYFVPAEPKDTKSASFVKLDLTGTLNKPVRDTASAHLTLYSADKTTLLDRTEPTSLALIDQFRPTRFHVRRPPRVQQRGRWRSRTS
jgi:hypothetical protein